MEMEKLRELMFWAVALNLISFSFNGYLVARHYITVEQCVEQAKGEKQ